MDLEVDRSPQPAAPKNLQKKVKSATRLRYEAEVNFLKGQNGELEEIRRKLGLSRRKICQLLLVDPSAWTRWTTLGGQPPPHIYRALDWYLSMMEKDPEYRRLSQRFSAWMNHEKDHEGRLANLEAQLREKILNVGESRMGGTDKRDKKDWRALASPLLAFLGGIILMYFLMQIKL